MTCTCSHIAIGLELTGMLNLNPECEEHGVGTDWWNSPEQVQRRLRQSERLKELQQMAARARARAKNLDA